ncbi:hypothetical protein GPN2_11720 [Streptomyces murinus]
MRSYERLEGGCTSPKGGTGCHPLTVHRSNSGVACGAHVSVKPTHPVGLSSRSERMVACRLAKL